MNELSEGVMFPVLQDYPYRQKALDIPACGT